MILDTNALSAAAGDDPAVLSILARASRVALPVIVIGEYRYGIQQSRHGARHRSWLEGLISACEVFDITEQTTHQYAAVATELRAAGKPIPTNDVWIAALCRQHNLPILSRDRHFDSIAGIQRLAW